MNSLYLQIKYLNIISSSLSLFVKKHDNLWNFRCPFCGDSQKNQRKQRGYIGEKDRTLLYYCHNCGASLNFDQFLKKLNIALYDEYIKEKLFDLREDDIPSESKEKPSTPKPEFLIDFLTNRLDTLDLDSSAVQYVQKRQIPQEQWKRIYFLDDVRKLNQLKESYRLKISDNEPRILFPIISPFSGHVTGIVARAIQPNAKVRYLNIKIKEDAPLIFGWEQLDTQKNFFVTEGAFDSLFLKNALAVSGISFFSLPREISRKNMIVIFDNEPRNLNIVKLVRKAINLNYRVVIFPSTIKSKDLNEMVLQREILIDNMEDFLYNHSYKGLQANLEFRRWIRK